MIATLGIPRTAVNGVAVPRQRMTSPGCPYCRERYPRMGRAHLLPGGAEQDCMDPIIVDHTETPVG